MIRIQQGYFLRSVLDMHVVMGTGKEAYAPNQIMSTNETGAFLWGLLEQGAEVETLVARLCEEYEVTAEDAARDVEAFLTRLREKALIAE